jgi:transcriptional regulator with XRE-family HTH domain
VQLDAAIPPRRFGRALKAARRAGGLRRPVAAARLGVSPRLLADWERGAARVPLEHHDALVDLYGEQLTTRVPARRPVRVESHRVVVGSRVRILGEPARDAVLPAYAELLLAVRNAKPGSIPALRLSDLQVLADALGHDVGDVEARIVRLLDCSPAEAATVHAELRRRALVPAAGLAVAVTAWAGALAATHPALEGTSPATNPIAATEPTTTTATVTAAPKAAAPAEAPTPRATSTTTTPTASTSGPSVAPTPTPVTPAPTLPPGNEGPDYESSATTTPAVDDPPVSILPGETPIIVQP